MMDISLVCKSLDKNLFQVQTLSQRIFEKKKNSVISLTLSEVSMFHQTFLEFHSQTLLQHPAEQVK